MRIICLTEVGFISESVDSSQVSLIVSNNPYLLGETYNFCFKNMSQATGLYSSGLKPVYKVVPDDEKWRNIPTEVTFEKSEESFTLQFSHTFDCSSTNSVYFCFSYPFGYEDVCKQMDELESRLKSSEDIYFYRELVTYTLERRRVELITITDHSNMTDSEEPFIRSLFPEAKNRKKSSRPKIFKKPTIFFSARVHPGEVAASHVLNGILKVLTDPDDNYGKLLRANFVFKIIPLLNPDGVYRGYFRLDTRGNNLNRFYKEPKIEEHPTIFAAKKVLLQQKELGKLCIYIDLHAHAQRKGCFMFGNSLPIPSQQVENMCLPKVISLNSVDFDFNQCSFAESNMNVKDKNSGLSREG
jgi:hypothetical protein